MWYRDALIRKLLMLGSLAVVAAGLPLVAQSTLRFEADKELRTGVVSQAEHFRPRWWNNSGLVGAENDRTVEPVIYVVSREGHREDVKFGIADASEISVYGVAGGSDGALAVIGYAVSPDWRRAAFVAWISPDRQQRVVTRLTPYAPDAVTIAADGTVWTAGYVVVDDSIPDYKVMRRFDKSGRLLGSFLPSTVIRHSAFSAGSYLLPSRDRVGWYLPMINKYMEFSLDGTLLDRLDGALWSGRTQQITGVALSENNELVVSRWDQQARKWELLFLDRAKRKWAPVGIALEQGKGRGKILGFDGENVLTSVDFRTISCYRPQAER